MAEINALMMIAQEENANAQSRVNIAVTIQSRADVALDTLKIQFLIHHGNLFHGPHSPQYIYKR